MRVVVVGAGGLGSYVGAVLARAGRDVTLVARGAHGDVIRDEGLHVATVDGDYVVRPACVDSALRLDGADVTFVGVKAFSLDEVAPQLVHLAERGSTVVPLLNGVSASSRLVAAGVSGDRLVDGIAYMTAFRTAPGRIVRRAAHHRLVVGSTTGADRNAVERVVETFSGTGVEVVVAHDIRIELWEKMAVVCSLSVLCGITGKPMGPIRGHPLGAALQRRAIVEVAAVARAWGAMLSDDAEARIGARLDAFPEDFHPSVIQDLKGGRRTEMQELGGAVVELGRATGVDTPLHEAATCAIQLAEKSGSWTGD